MRNENTREIIWVDGRPYQDEPICEDCTPTKTCKTCRGYEKENRKKLIAYENYGK